MEAITIPRPALVEVKKLTVDGQNPNRMTPQELERLKSSITRFGFIVPIITNSQLLIADGEQRLEAAQSLGMTHVPVVKLPVEDVDRRLLRQVLNKLRGTHDLNADAYEFQRIIQAGHEDTLKTLLALSDSQLERYMQEIREHKDEDHEIPELDKVQTDIQRGDIYTLGSHRLMCGDATVDIPTLMGNAKADMLFTDPPYGINLNPDWSNIKGSHKARMGQGVRGKKYPKIIGDDKPFQFPQIDVEEQFWFGADYYHHQLPSGGAWLVWDKRLGESQDKAFGTPFELIWSRKQHRKEVIRKFWSGAFGFQEDTEHRIHPTQKPLEVCRWVLNKYSHSPDIILDPYGGSGSTLIACEQTKHRCYMMEIDPRYCQVIINRWQQYTGETAEIVKG